MWLRFLLSLLMHADNPFGVNVGLVGLAVCLAGAALDSCLELCAKEATARCCECLGMPSRRLACFLILLHWLRRHSRQSALPSIMREAHSELGQHRDGGLQRGDYLLHLTDCSSHRPAGGDLRAKSVRSNACASHFSLSKKAINIARL